MGAKKKYKVVLLGSGDTESGSGGSTIQAILRSVALGLVDFDVSVVICNNSRQKVPGFYQKIDDHNKEFGVDVEVRTINGTGYPAGPNEKVEHGAQTLAEAQACADVVKETAANLYVLAGFMKKTVGALLEYDGLNTHPGPLENGRGVPGVDTKGTHGIGAQEAVLARGFPYSAHTVHKVVADYDSGEIVAWRPVLVLPDDTAESLFSRVQVVEKACLPFDIDDYLKSRRK